MIESLLQAVGAGDSVDSEESSPALDKLLPIRLPVAWARMAGGALERRPHTVLRIWVGRTGEKYRDPNKEYRDPQRPP